MMDDISISDYSSTPTKKQIKTKEYRRFTEKTTLAIKETQIKTMQW